MTLQTWIAAGAILGVLCSALVLAGMIGRPLRKLARQNDEFREDWYGTAARPGRERVPGVPERLSNIELQQQSNGDAVAQLAVRLDDHIRAHGGTP